MNFAPYLFPERFTIRRKIVISNAYSRFQICLRHDLFGTVLYIAGHFFLFHQNVLVFDEYFHHSVFIVSYIVWLR